MMRSPYDVPGDAAGSLYRVLDVAPEASQKSIVHAYRQQARASHPDARPEDPGAIARFRVLTNAYEVLSDPVRRADYDRERRSSGAAGPAHRSGGYRPGQEGRVRTGGPRIGVRNSPDVFLDARPARPSGAPLWAGPVHVEGLPSETATGFRWPQAPRELDGLPTLLLGFLTDRWWSE